LRVRHLLAPLDVTVLGFDTKSGGPPGHWVCGNRVPGRRRLARPHYPLSCPNRVTEVMELNAAQIGSISAILISAVPGGRARDGAAQAGLEQTANREHPISWRPHRAAHPHR
jgi:hypothetical protein